MAGRNRRNRRSFSVAGITYQRLKDYCDKEGLSVSGLLEDIITDEMDAARVPVPKQLRPIGPVTKKSLDLEEAVSKGFTF